MQPAAGQSFRQVKVTRTFEQICDQILERLANGGLQPGDKLPAERDLALEFDVGRPAVREALRTLEISGIVTLRKGPKGGAFIHAGDPTMLTRSLQNLMLLKRISIGSLAEARALISNMVVRLACERATEEDYADIACNIEDIESIPDLGRRTEAGVQFFHLIARSTKNEVLMFLVDSLGDIIRFMTDRTHRSTKPELGPIRRQILEAMRLRDADRASRLMERYMTVTHADVHRLA